MKKRTKILLWILFLSFIIFVTYRFITYEPYPERRLHEYIGEICGF